MTPSEPPSDPPPQPPSEPSDPSSDAAREMTSEEKAEELRAFNTREQDAAWRSVAYLISGPLVYGGIGYLLDRWLGTTWIVGVGIVGGMALSLYLIWFRYGSH
jgi:F0F1-type ATP synthase assembly protein I